MAKNIVTNSNIELNRLVGKASKRITRERFRGQSPHPSFSELIRIPRYRYVAASCVPSDMKKYLKTLGFKCASDVAAFDTFEDLLEVLGKRKKSAHKLPDQGFFAEAKRQAQVEYNSWRMAQIIKDPMNQMLRHSVHQLPESIERALKVDELQYVSPDSIASSQSMAAYLTHLYKIATGANGEYSIQDGDLAARRPDLAALSLSENNLSQEITTLELVNEVMEKKLGHPPGQDFDGNIYRTYYPLPATYDPEQVGVRLALQCLDGLSINALCQEATKQDFSFIIEELNYRPHRLVTDAAEALCLNSYFTNESQSGDDANFVGNNYWDTGDDLKLICNTQGLLESNVPTHELYGLSSSDEIHFLSNVDTFMQRSGLTFDELKELLGLYQIASDDSGLQLGERNLNSTFIAINNPSYRFAIDNVSKKIQFNAENLRIETIYRQMHYLNRLNRRSGLSFFELNLLLQMDGAATLTWSDSYTNCLSATELSATEEQKVGEGAFLLAHFLYYRDRFGLNVHEFSAMLAEIGHIYRPDWIVDASDDGLVQHERSLMRELFGDAAPRLLDMIPEVSLEPSSFTEGTAYSELTDWIPVLCNGLQLTQQEWEAFVDFLGWNANTNINRSNLAVIYRLATIIRLAGWEMKDGLHVMKVASLANTSTKVMPSDFPVLSKDRLTVAHASCNGRFLSAMSENSVSCGQTLSELNRFLSLSEWMQEHEVTVDILDLVITGSLELISTESEFNWIEQLYASIDPLRVLENYFQWVSTEVWLDQSGDILLTTNPVFTPKNWIDVLIDNSLIDTNGLTASYHPTLADSITEDPFDRGFDTETAKTAINNFLTTNGVAAEQAEEVSNRVAEDLTVTKFEQASALDTAINKRHSEFPNFITEYLLRWIGTDCYYILKVLTPLTSGVNARSINVIGKLQIEVISQLERYLTVASKLKLSDLEIAIVGNHGGLFSTEERVPYINEKGHPLDLEQFFHLHNLKALQVGASTIDFWNTYLHEVMPYDQASEEQILQGLHKDDTPVTVGDTNEEVGQDNDRIIKFNTLLAELLDTTLEDINQLLAERGLPLGIRLTDLGPIAQQVNQMKRLGVQASELLSWLRVAQPRPTGMNDGDNAVMEQRYRAAAKAAEMALKRYDGGSQWSTYRNRRNEKDRDSLLAELLANDYYLTSAEEVYMHLLLDVNVSSAVPTSRIVEAVSSLQLYINRVLLDLESPATINDKAAFLANWELDRQYRVWEANEKLGLYPANYIEPELRPGKTNLFIEFESALSQDVSPASIDSAVKGYMASLSTLTEINPVAVCYEDIDDTYCKVHLIGRRGERKSASYYYRTMIINKDVYLKTFDFLEKMCTVENTDVCNVDVNLLFASEQETILKMIEWSPWEKIDIPIGTADRESNIAVGAKWGNLYIFWLEASKGQEGQEDWGAVCIKYDKQLNGINLPVTAYDGFWEEVRQFNPEKPPILDSFAYIGGQIYGAIMQNDTVQDPYSGRWCHQISNTAAFHIVQGCDLTILNHQDQTLSPWFYYDPYDLNTDMPDRVHRAFVDNQADLKYLRYAGMQIFTELYKSTGATAFLHFNSAISSDTDDESPRRAGCINLRPKTSYTYEQPLNTMIQLTSNALYQVAHDALQESGCEGVFTLANQKRDEISAEKLTKKYEEYLTKHSASSVDSILNNYCFNFLDVSPLTFNFNGSCGLYGWEVFYHMPMSIASQCLANGDYIGAKKWLEMIYNPLMANSTSPESAWNVVPLQDAITAEISAMSGRAYNDPDDLAQDNPVIYCQATIRHYLEMLLAAGDQAYSKQTQESLQTAKLLYVSAKNLFAEENDNLLQLNPSLEWDNPTLDEAITNYPFIPPYNQELRGLYDKLGDRLDKLRNWLDLSGNPLNIPLLAPPIDPLLPRNAVQGGVLSANQSKRTTSRQLNGIDFRTCFNSAISFVRDMQQWSSDLQSALAQKDATALANHRQELELSNYDAAIAIQESRLEIAKLNLEQSQSRLEQLTVQVEGDEVLEEVNESGVKAEVMALGQKAGKKIQLALESIQSLRARIVKSKDKIAGVAAGFTDPGIVEQINVEQELVESEQEQTKLETALLKLQAMKANIVAATQRYVHQETVKEFTADVAAAQKVLDQERMALGFVKTHRNKTEDLQQWMLESFTNEEFYSYLTAELEQIFQDAFDVTLQFCQSVQELYREVTEDDTYFIGNNYWDNRYKGLMAPYKLALDMEKMDLAFFGQTNKMLNRASSRVSFLLSELPALGLERSSIEQLRDKGEVILEVTDDMLDIFYPNQYSRCIKSVSVTFPDLKEGGLSPHAKLELLANKRYRTSERKDNKSTRNVMAGQVMLLDSPCVDSGQLEPVSGLRPFQGAGAASVWRLCFPSLVELELDGGQSRSPEWRKAVEKHRDMLRKSLSEVKIEITYTSRS